MSKWVQKDQKQKGMGNRKGSRDRSKSKSKERVGNRIRMGR